MRVKKFNEVVESKLANDRVSEIISDLKSISLQMDKDLNKCSNITKELNKYTTKSKKNNQIDDSFVSFESLCNKLKDCLSTISNITDKLNDYNENGEQYLY